MLRLDMTSILDNRGIEKPTRFLLKAGFIYYTATRLLREPGRAIRLDQLEKLCIALNCSVEDLIVWQPPKEMRNVDEHPLSRLKPRKRKGNITAPLKHLSAKKLDLVRDYIEKLYNSDTPS